MEIRRATDALLRCQASPFTYHATPSTSLSLSCRNRHTKTARRTITSSTRRCAVKLPPPVTTSGNQPTDQKQSSIQDFQTLWPKSTRAPRPTSTFGNSASFERRLNGGSSDNDLMTAWSSKTSQYARSASAFDSMLSSASIGGNPPSIFDGLYGGTKKEVLAPKPPSLRLTPSTGRTVSVGARVDVSRAFVLLSQSCARNAVQRDYSRQRFHERPGLKRKRLVSQRWRKKFKQGFKAAVARVQRLRKQGW